MSEKDVHTQVSDYTELLKQVSKFPEEFTPSRTSISRATVPLSYKYADGKKTVVWLHFEVERWFPNIFEQAQKARAWTTDAEEGGNPISVGKLWVQMYGYWDGGNKTTEVECSSCSSVATDTKRGNTFPFPVFESGVSGTAKCEVPNIGPITVRL